MQLLRLVIGVVGVGGSILPLFAGPSFFKHQGVPGWVGAVRRVAMDTSSSCLSIARLHQLCRHQRPSSSIGDEFKVLLTSRLLDHQISLYVGYFKKMNVSSVSPFASIKLFTITGVYIKAFSKL